MNRSPRWCLRRARRRRISRCSHFVGQSAWSDEAMYEARLAKVRELAAPAFAAQGGVEAWIVDDTGFQKKFAFGRRGASILRAVGKTDNCQIAVSLSIANHQRVCRSPIGSICRRTGRTTPSVEKRRTFPRAWSFAPSRRSRYRGRRQGWCGQGRRADRRGLRLRRDLPRRRHGAGAALCGGGGYAARGSRRRHQAALAYRTRLRGIEERTRPSFGAKA